MAELKLTTADLSVKVRELLINLGRGMYLANVLNRGTWHHQNGGVYGSLRHSILLIVANEFGSDVASVLDKSGELAADEDYDDWVFQAIDKAVEAWWKDHPPMTFEGHHLEAVVGRIKAELVARLADKHMPVPADIAHFYDLDDLGFDLDSFGGFDSAALTPFKRDPRFKAFKAKAFNLVDMWLECGELAALAARRIDR